MPVYKDKRTQRFYVEFQYKGVRFKERLPDTATRKDAERLEIKVKNDLMFQSHGIQDDRSVTFEEFVRTTYGPYVESHHAPDSLMRAVIVCKAALPFFKGKPLRSIKAADIERFKASRINAKTMHGTARKPATVEREMSILSRIFSMAVKNDICEYNPCSRVDKLKFDNVQDKVLLREDEPKLLANMNSEWARDVCLMVLNTGLRQNDLMNLTRKDVRLDENCIRLTQKKTKRRVEIMLNRVSREILERRMSNNLLFASPKSGLPNGSVRHTIQRACVRAKIPVLTIRDLRRTFATRSLENGADAMTVSRMLGHSSLRMIPRYARSIELMQKAVDNLAPSTPVPPTSKSKKRKVLKEKEVKEK